MIVNRSSDRVSLYLVSDFKGNNIDFRHFHRYPLSDSGMSLLNLDC